MLTIADPKVIEVIPDAVWDGFIPDMTLRMAAFSEANGRVGINDAPLFYARIAALASLHNIAPQVAVILIDLGMTIAGWHQQEERAELERLMAGDD